MTSYVSNPSGMPRRIIEGPGISILEDADIQFVLTGAGGVMNIGAGANQTVATWLGGILTGSTVYFISGSIGINSQPKFGTVLDVASIMGAFTPNFDTSNINGQFPAVIRAGTGTPYAGMMFLGNDSNEQTLNFHTVNNYLFGRMGFNPATPQFYLELRTGTQGLAGFYIDGTGTFNSRGSISILNNTAYQKMLSLLSSDNDDTRLYLETGTNRTIFQAHETTGTAIRFQNKFNRPLIDFGGDGSFTNVYGPLYASGTISGPAITLTYYNSGSNPYPLITLNNTYNNATGSTGIVFQIASSDRFALKSVVDTTSGAGSVGALAFMGGSSPGNLIEVGRMTAGGRLFLTKSLDTTNPTIFAKLNIKGANSNSEGGYGIYLENFSGTSKWVIHPDSTAIDGNLSMMRYRTGTGQLQTILTMSYQNGFVGVNTTTPVTNFHVSGSAFVSDILAVGTQNFNFPVTVANNNASQISFFRKDNTPTDSGGFLGSNVRGQGILSNAPFLTGTGWVAISSGTAYVAVNPAGDITFGTTAYNVTGTTVSPAERARIAGTNGRLGIGTIAPNALLDVNGDIFATGSVRLGGVTSSGAIQMRQITVNTGTTGQLLPVTGNGAGTIAVIHIVGNGASVAIYGTAGSNNQAFEISDPSAIYSVASGTANSFNIYYDGTKYALQNNRSISQAFTLFIFGNS